MEIVLPTDRRNCCEADGFDFECGDAPFKRVLWRHTLYHVAQRAASTGHGRADQTPATATEWQTIVGMQVWRKHVRPVRGRNNKKRKRGQQKLDPCTRGGCPRHIRPVGGGHRYGRRLTPQPTAHPKQHRRRHHAAHHKRREAIIPTEPPACPRLRPLPAGHGTGA